MSQNTTTLERYPTFNFDNETLQKIHVSKRQLNKKDDAVNTVLVLASRMSRSSEINTQTMLGTRLMKFLNNNATGRLRLNDDELHYVFGRGDGVCGLIHNVTTGRMRRTK